MKKILLLFLCIGTMQVVIPFAGGRGYGSGRAWGDSRPRYEQRLGMTSDQAGAAFPSLSGSVSSVTPTSKPKGAWTTPLVPPVLLDEESAMAPRDDRSGAAGGGGVRPRTVSSDLQDGSHGAGGGLAGGAAGGGSARVDSVHISNIRKENFYQVSFTGLALLFKYLYFNESVINGMQGYLSVDAYERSLVNAHKPLLNNVQWEGLGKEFETSRLYKQAAECYKKAGNKEESQRLFNLFGDQLKQKIRERVNFVDFNQNIQERLGLVYTIYEALRAYENAKNKSELQHLRKRLSEFVSHIYNAAIRLKYENKKQAMQLFSFLCLIKSELINILSGPQLKSIKDSILELAKLCREEKDLVLSIIEKIKANFKYKEASEIYILLGDRSNSSKLVKEERSIQHRQGKERKKLSSSHTEDELEGEDVPSSGKEPESEDEAEVEPEMPDRSTVVSDMSPWFEGEDEDSVAARVFAGSAGYFQARQTAARAIEKAWGDAQNRRRRLALREMQAREDKRREEEKKAPELESIHRGELPESVAAALGYILDDEEDGSHGAGSGAASGGAAGAASGGGALPS